MSPDRYDRGSSRSRRGVWSHWVPLAVTLTVATVGVAAWVWSQRSKDGDEENDHEPDLDYDNADYGENPAYGTSRDIKGPEKPPRPDEETHGVSAVEEEHLNAGWGSRMSGALRRTPSPQQFFDNTGKNITAGVAAVSAAMGKALASIREEDKSPYGDSNPWSEEADAKKERGPERGPAAGPSTGSSSNTNTNTNTNSNRRRKTVAIVVSADSHGSGDEDDSFHEHASILSHIPGHNDFSKIKLFVLIYAPGVKDTALEASTSNLPPASLSSSFSNIGPDQVQTPGEESKNLGTSNSAFNAVYSQALGLVEKETMILPFTTPNGHVHILRHLQPEVIYLQESLAGDNGSIITNLQTWLRHDVILVVGADGGSGGLADSESEAERSTKVEQWWQRPERVGRGRGVVVVDGMRVNDDWARRVQGQE